MSTDLSRKRQVHAGHRVLATKTNRQVEDILAVDTSDIEKMAQLRLTLSENPEIVKLLAAEVLDMVEGRFGEEKIEQPNRFKEGSYVVMHGQD